MAAAWPQAPGGPLPQWAGFPPYQQPVQLGPTIGGGFQGCAPPAVLPVPLTQGFGQAPPQQLSMGPLPGMPANPQAQAAGFMAPIMTQLSSSRIPLPHLGIGGQPDPQQQMQLYADSQQQHQQQHQHAEVTATVTITAAAPFGKAAAAAVTAAATPTDTLLADLQAQLQLRQAAAAQAGNWGLNPHYPQLNQGPQQQQQQQQSPCLALDELQLLLPAVHAEYKAEMQLMLRACQVASSATRHSTATGSTLLLDPASRQQLQRQVLANCNDKHAVVTAAFRQAAQAVEAAAAAAGCSSSSIGVLGKQQTPLMLQAGNPTQGQAVPMDISDSTPAGSVNPQQGATHLTSSAACAGGGSGGDAAGSSSSSMARVWQCLQQLRSSYQQELVAATSALFAFCRGFGQRYALSPAASAAIKAALAAAQRQHARVEQLWQDVVLAAGGA